MNSLHQAGFKGNACYTPKYLNMGAYTEKKGKYHGFYICQPDSYLLYHVKSAMYLLICSVQVSVSSSRPATFLKSTALWWVSCIQDQTDGCELQSIFVIDPLCDDGLGMLKLLLPIYLRTWEYMSMVSSDTEKESPLNIESSRLQRNLEISAD